MSSEPEPPFRFSDDLSPDANIQAFLRHLDGKDQVLARVLRDNLKTLLEADDQQRHEARQRFNRAVSEALDAELAAGEGAE